MKISRFRWQTILGVLLFAMSSAAWAAKTPGASHPMHPLAPLDRAELESTLLVLQQSGKLEKGSLFPSIALEEPPKSEVIAYDAAAASVGGKPVTFRREAKAIVFDRDHNQTFEAIVDLRSKKLISWKKKDGVQPAISMEELNAIPAIVRADSRWQDAIRKRGILRFDDVMVDPWAPGLLSKDEVPTTRWVRALSYMKGKSRNGYARPIEGIVAVVDMTRKKVEKIIDTGVRPVPPQVSDFDEKSVGPQRTAPKPLVVSQPQGPSFEVHGQEVRWQKWRFRFGVHPREGLVLYTVGYEDEGRVRPVLHRASLSEMVVPYGDPASNWTFRNAFDEGEYGIGRLTDSLEIGTDAPKHARFFDFVYANDFGKAVDVPRAVALYERDGGLLWKHFEYYAGKSESRRGRELVLFSIVTVGNYDYGMNWIFRQDGSLEFQAVLTGIMLAKGVAQAKMDEHSHDGDPHSHLVAPYVAAPHHQHFFNMRVDLDVDGALNNNIAELNVRSMPSGSENPAHNGIVMEATPLKREQEAQRDLNFEMARKWVVTHSTRKNGLGYSTGYALIPADNSIPYLRPESKIRQRAGFIDHHMWATAYDPKEMHAADDYPNQSSGGEGLPTWTKANRSLENTDLVLWYTFGVTHIPRPEEWPIMSIHTGGFKLLPVGFFTRNPSMDVPR